MSWLDTSYINPDFEDVLSLRPELKVGFDTFIASLAQSSDVPLDILALCREQVAMNHNVSITGKNTEALVGAEVLANAVAEKISYDHHAITDEEVSALVHQFGEGGAVTLLTASAFYDVVKRLERVWATREEGG